MSKFCRRVFLAVIVPLAAQTAQAQQPQRASRPPVDSSRMGNGMRMLQFIQSFQMASSRELAPAINSLLQDDGAHMRMAPRRAVAKGDSARAAEIVKTAREALGKYSDIAVAEADGYVKFLPFVEDQVVYHYNHVGNAMTILRGFDATKPVSLLYKKNAKGTMKLVGAMYNAMPTATPEDLDARLPTSIAHWHEHVNFCSANPDSVRSGAVKFDAATAAKWLKITTKEGCDVVGGRFIPRIFGWMAHVYLFAGDDPRVIWGEGHGSMDVHTHRPPR